MIRPGTLVGPAVLRREPRHTPRLLLGRGLTHVPREVFSLEREPRCVQPSQATKVFRAVDVPDRFFAVVDSDRFLHDTRRNQGMV